MATGRIISGSRPASLLIGRVWFNCNRVFSRFEETGSGIVTPAPPHPSSPQPGYILKIIFY